MTPYEEAPKKSRLWRWTKRLAKIALVAVLVSVPAVYFGVPAVAKTKWAREKAERALARAIKAPVDIGEMSFSWRRGLTVRDVKSEGGACGRLEVSAHVREIKIRPEWRRIVRGRAQGKLSIVEPQIRLREAAAGTPAGLPRFGCGGVEFRELQIVNGSLVYEAGSFDEDLRVEGLNVSGTAYGRKDRIDLDLRKIEGKLNGGAVKGSAFLALRPGDVSARLDLDAQDVEFGDLTARALRYAVPLVETLPSGTAKGRVDLRFRAEGEGETFASLLRSASGEGEVRVRDGRVSGSRILAAGAKTMSRPALIELSLHEAEASRFTLFSGKVHTSLVARSREGECRLQGWTGVDGKLGFVVILGDGTSFAVEGTFAAPVVLADEWF